MRVNKSLLLLLCVILVSCSTTKTRSTSEIPLNLNESSNLVFATEPDSTPLLIPEVKTEADLVALLENYKAWGESWQDYAYRLTDYIKLVREELNK